MGRTELAQALLRGHILRQGLAVIQLHPHPVGAEPRYRARQVSAEGRSRDEQRHTEEQSHHRGPVALAVTLEVFGRQHPGKAEQLPRQGRGLYLPAPDLHVLGLADGLYRRQPHRPPGGDPGGNHRRDQADARRRQQRPQIQHEPHLHCAAAFPAGQKAEAAPQAVQGHADAQAAHQQPQRDAHGAQHQRLIQDAAADLFFRCPHRFQDAKLAGPLRHGNGKCVVDQRHRPEEDQQQQNRRKVIEQPVHRQDTGGAIVIQQGGVGVPRQSRIFLGISLHIAVKAAGVGHPEKFIRLIALLLTGQGSIAGAGEGLRRHIQPLVKAHHSVGVGRGICQRLPLRIGVIGRQLLPTQRPVAQLQLHGVPQDVPHIAVGQQVLRQENLPRLFRQTSAGQPDGHQLRQVGVHGHDPQIRLILVLAADIAPAHRLPGGYLRDLLFITAQLRCLLLREVLVAAVEPAHGVLRRAHQIPHAAVGSLRHGGEHGHRQHDAHDGHPGAGAVLPQGLPGEAVEYVHFCTSRTR